VLVRSLRKHMSCALRLRHPGELFLATRQKKKASKRLYRSLGPCAADGLGKLNSRDLCPQRQSYGITRQAFTKPIKKSHQCSNIRQLMDSIKAFTGRASSHENLCDIRTRSLFLFMVYLTTLSISRTIWYIRRGQTVAREVHVALLNHYCCSFVTDGLTRNLPHVTYCRMIGQSIKN
jgi:hypothetical protein